MATLYAVAFQDCSTVAKAVGWWRQGHSVNTLAMQHQGVSGTDTVYQLILSQCRG